MVRLHPLQHMKQEKFEIVVRSHCTLCDIHFVVAITNHSIEENARSEAISKLKEELEEHFETSDHKLKNKEFNYYNKEVINYINKQIDI